MKRFAFILTLVLASCVAVPASVSPEDSATESASVSTPTNADNKIKPPPLNASWHIQYTGQVKYDLEVDVYNLDLFDTDASDIAQLHERNIYVMCYFSAGSFEDWRPDGNQFPRETLGNDMEGWPGEKWLDIRQIDLLASVIESRLDLAREKNCDGVDPDNVNGYTNDTGFPLTYKDQRKFNMWLAQAAHARGLAIGLKNDIEQIPDLVSYFDWQLNEQCFYYEECEPLLLFILQGKPVFNIEYELSTREFCDDSDRMGFNSIRKHMNLDEYAEFCH